MAGEGERAADARWRLGAGAAVVLVLGAVAGGVVQRMVADAQPAVVAATPVATASTGPAEVVVDVQGAVAHPGVYRLPAGSRVLDAIARAGGTSAEAAPGALNLARPVVDGEQLLVPTEGEQAEAAAASPEQGALVSLNQSDQAALETLPRVGPTLALAIIAHRDEQGPFTDVAQLDDVPGIGPALLAALTPLVTL
ncbi:ComEA family DNA-binding protein [Agrococcus jenensis]|uniref:Competence protein ComEA n=1 Tax=Agrococcus jenensis TaxID=46353 RepID=A0A3N2AW23_9MICO|nr:ComEA family DNA-binding protein [Agrococcus jenensis]ROR67231.1 competence protein ComEA [Agrococcus jenensis]